MLRLNTRPSRHQLVRERGDLDADPEQLRVERHLRGPVQRHAVAAFALVGAAEHVETARHRPEHAAAEAVVLLGILTGRKRTDETFVQRHAAEVTTARDGPARSRSRARPSASGRSSAAHTAAPSRARTASSVGRRSPRPARRYAPGARRAARPRRRNRTHDAGAPGSDRSTGPSPAPRSCPRRVTASATRRPRIMPDPRLGECHHTVVGREAIVALEGELEAEPDRVAVHRHDHRHLDRRARAPRRLDPNARRASPRPRERCRTP